MDRAHPDVELPDVLHRTVELPASIARVVIVGDVHACFDELEALLQACAFDASRDQLVFVGDLVNKGPKPIEVVRFVRESGALCVRGNHDDAALAAYNDWRAHGSVPNTAKYTYVEQFEPADAHFLAQLPFSLTLPQFNTVVVHAGLVPGIALVDQRPVDLYKMRFVKRDGPTATWCALESQIAAGSSDSDTSELHRWATQWCGPQHVVFGHDAVPGLQHEAFATGIDTGCCYGRALSACILPSREIVQVPALRAYAPVPTTSSVVAATAAPTSTNAAGQT